MTGHDELRERRAALMNAVEEQDVDAVSSQLPSLGADVDVVDETWNTTPLWLAVDAAADSARHERRAPDDRIVRLLVEAGASPETRSPDGSTPIELALRYGWYELVSAFRNLAASGRWTSTPTTAPRGREEVKAAIVSAIWEEWRNLDGLLTLPDVDLDLVDGPFAEGLVAMAVRAAVARVDPDGAEPDARVVRALIAAGASPTVPDRYGRSAVDVAEAAGWTSLAGELRRHGSVR